MQEKHSREGSSDSRTPIQPWNPELTEADDTLRITLRHKAAFAPSSPDVSGLQTTPGKVKRCRLRGLIQ